MAAAAGRSKEAGVGGCRRHPSHRQSAGVCPFCLCDRLSRLPSAAGGNGGASGSCSVSSPSSSVSSTRSSGEESVTAAPRCREARRARLGLLMRQEEAEAETTTDRHEEAAAAAAAAAAPGGEKKAKRSNFWARLQQGSWYRKADGCSLAHSKTSAVAIKSAAAPKRAPLF